MGLSALSLGINYVDVFFPHQALPQKITKVFKICISLTAHERKNYVVMLMFTKVKKTLPGLRSKIIPNKNTFPCLILKESRIDSYLSD